MDPVCNPFSPGAGSKPPELVGRDAVLETARVLFARIRRGRAEKSIVLTGLRGVGKTVLLNEAGYLAEAAGYELIQIEAHEDKPLAAMLAPALRKVLFRLDRMKGARDKVRRGFAVMRSFIPTISVTYEDITVGLDIDPERGTADSGDLEHDLPDLLAVVAEAAQSRDRGVALLIDELQYLKAKELSALIMAMHRMQQRSLPLVLVGAGLPLLPKLAGESKSYAERLLAFPDIGPLNDVDAARAVREPVHGEQASIEAAAVQAILKVTQGYPYFLQEWGYQSWNTAEGDTIKAPDVTRATPAAIARLDENFFRVRFQRLTPGEKTFLRACAQLGAGPYVISDVADVMGLKTSSLSPRRSHLIEKGMIYSVGHGEIDFTVPLFDDFMRRQMPEFKP